MSFIEGTDGWFDAQDVSAVRVKQFEPAGWFVVVELSNGIGMCADGPFSSREEARSAREVGDGLRRQQAGREP